MPHRAPAWRRLAPLLVLLLAVVLAACAGAGGTPEVTVSDARIGEPAGPNAAAYMTLRNDGDGDARLTSVSVDAGVAERAELHETTMDGGAMSMQHVDGIDVPAGGTAVLEPGGFHVMLLGVDEGLRVGDTVTLTLGFDDGSEQSVDAEVVPLTEESAS